MGANDSEDSGPDQTVITETIKSTLLNLGTNGMMMSVAARANSYVVVQGDDGGLTLTGGHSATNPLTGSESLTKAGVAVTSLCKHVRLADRALYWKETEGTPMYTAAHLGLHQYRGFETTAEGDVVDYQAKPDKMILRGRCLRNWVVPTSPLIA